VTAYVPKQEHMTQQKNNNNNKKKKIISSVLNYEGVKIICEHI